MSAQSSSSKKKMSQFVFRSVFVRIKDSTEELTCVSQNARAGCEEIAPFAHT